MKIKFDRNKNEKKLKKSKVNAYIDGDCLVINISGILTIRTIDAILSELIEIKKNETDTITNMLFDLSEVDFVQPSGVVGLVCLCSALVKNQIDELFKISNMYIRHPSECVLTYLVNLNFFTWMSTKAKLLGCEDLVNSEYKIEQQRKQKLHNSNNQLDYDNNTIIWPMTLIPCKGQSIADQDFENVAQHFLNQAHNCFEKLFSSSHFNFSKAKIHDFWGANYELYYNIFAHSKSWGLATIHARPNYGTAVCYYDIGIGFKESVNTAPRLEKKFETDIEAIKWAMVDGNTSNPNRIRHDGHGLTIVQDLVLSAGGILEIRSGKCLLQRKSKELDWKAYNVPWFPGAQISFFVPCQK